MKKYFRIINAYLPKGTRKVINGAHIASHLRSFLFLFFIILIGIIFQLLVTLNGEYKKVRELYSQRSTEYKYWTSVASQYPNIPDILYNASISSYNFGKLPEAKNYLERALKIDPVFKKAQEFERELSE